MSCYKFKTKLFGLSVEITGEFEAEELETLTDPKISAAFVIEYIEHSNGSIDIDDLSDQVLCRIEKQAHEAATKEVSDDY